MRIKFSKEQNVTSGARHRGNHDPVGEDGDSEEARGSFSGSRSIVTIDGVVDTWRGWGVQVLRHPSVRSDKDMLKKKIVTRDNNFISDMFSNTQASVALGDSVCLVPQKHW